MQKLLIAEHSEEITDGLVRLLRDDFILQTCRNGEEALVLLQTFRPEVLIVDLMLPFLDGLTLLQRSAYRPTTILALSTYTNAQIAGRAMDLGVGALLVTPKLSAVKQRLLDLIREGALGEEKTDLQTQTSRYLQLMHFATGREGYYQLCVGIPMFFRDPHQSLSKELYPAIARACGAKSGDAVERAIRTAIEDAWAHKSPEVWQEYFPNCYRCPSNKVLIARIAELLKEY